MLTNKNIHVLRQGNKTMSYTHKVLDTTKNYVIGFPSPTLARHVHYSIEREPKIHVERNLTMNVTDDVNHGLINLGINPVNSQVTIDTNALLYISKSQQRQPICEIIDDNGLHLDHMLTEDFLMLPFESNLGIVIANEVEYESNKELVLKSHVIDPAFDAYHAMMSFKAY